MVYLVWKSFVVHPGNLPSQPQVPPGYLPRDGGSALTSREICLELLTHLNCPIIRIPAYLPSLPLPKRVNNALFSTGRVYGLIG